MNPETVTLLSKFLETYKPIRGGDPSLNAINVQMESIYKYVEQTMNNESLIDKRTLLSMFFYLNGFDEIQEISAKPLIFKLVYTLPLEITITGIAFEDQSDAKTSQFFSDTSNIFSMRVNLLDDLKNDTIDRGTVNRLILGREVVNTLATLLFNRLYKMLVTIHVRREKGLDNIQKNRANFDRAFFSNLEANFGISIGFFHNIESRWAAVSDEGAHYWLK